MLIHVHRYILLILVEKVFSHYAFHNKKTYPFYMYMKTRHQVVFLEDQEEKEKENRKKKTHIPHISP